MTFLMSIKSSNHTQNSWWQWVPVLKGVRSCALLNITSLIRLCSPHSYLNSPALSPPCTVCLIILEVLCSMWRNVSISSFCTKYFSIKVFFPSQLVLKSPAHSPPCLVCLIILEVFYLYWRLAGGDWLVAGGWWLVWVLRFCKQIAVSSVDLRLGE